MSPSPRVRVFMACAMDGSIAGPDNDLSFLHAPGPEGSPQADPEAMTFERFMPQVGSMIMGRTTYDVVAAMDVPWPYGDTPVLVATHRDLSGAPDSVTTVAGSIEEIVAQAKQIAGSRDVYVDGGAVVRQALDHGLVDELCLTLIPATVGGGIRLFDGVQRDEKWAFETPRWAGNGMIQLTATRR